MLSGWLRNIRVLVQVVVCIVIRVYVFVAIQTTLSTKDQFEEKPGAQFKEIVQYRNTFFSKVCSVIFIFAV